MARNAFIGIRIVTCGRTDMAKLIIVTFRNFAKAPNNAIYMSNHVKRSVFFIYRQFNIQQFCVLPTQCIYVFCVDLRTNSDYFPIQH